MAQIPLVFARMGIVAGAVIIGLMPLAVWRLLKRRVRLRRARPPPGETDTTGRNRHRTRNNSVRSRRRCRRSGSERHDRSRRCHRGEATGAEPHRGATFKRNHQVAGRQYRRSAAAHSRNFAGDRQRRGALCPHPGARCGSERHELRRGAPARLKCFLTIWRRSSGCLRYLSHRHRRRR